jgi:dienelactone hydrolase
MLFLSAVPPCGIKNTCNGAQADRALATLGAPDFLAQLSFIDSRRIAAVGFSQGGGAALAAIDAHNVATLSVHRFKAAVLYPPPVRQDTEICLHRCWF